jgi:hypothetical protein
MAAPPGLLPLQFSAGLTDHSGSNSSFAMATILLAISSGIFIRLVIFFGLHPTG